MENKNIIIIGGIAVLAGAFLFNRNKKNKLKNDTVTQAQSLALIKANNQAKADAKAKADSDAKAKADLDAKAKADAKALADAKANATLLATTTIAKVNTIFEKNPVTSVADRINNVQHEFVNAIGDYLPVLNLLAQKDAQLNDAQIAFDFANQRRAFWKNAFAQVYKDLKDYYSSISKEQGEIISQYLPKFIAYELGGFDSKQLNTIFSDQDKMALVDNNILDVDGIVSKALPNVIKSAPQQKFSIPKEITLQVQNLAPNNGISVPNKIE